MLVVAEHDLPMLVGDVVAKHHEPAIRLGRLALIHHLNFGSDFVTGADGLQEACVLDPEQSNDTIAQQIRRHRRREGHYQVAGTDSAGKATAAGECIVKEERNRVADQPAKCVVIGIRDDTRASLIARADLKVLEQAAHGGSPYSVMIRWSASRRSCSGS